MDTRDLIIAGVLCTKFCLSRPNCPPGVLSWDLGLSNIFGCCLVNSCGGGGLIRWILWHSGSPGKEHHAKLWEGVSNWHLWAASLIQHLLMIEFRVHFWLCIPVSSLHSQLIGKLLVGSFFPVGELSQNWSCSLLNKVGELCYLIKVGEV